MIEKRTLYIRVAEVVYFLGLALGLYWVCLDGPFYVDDYSAIVANNFVRDMGSLLYSFHQRWLGYLSFAINYQISVLQPEGYRIVNVFIHGFNGFLVMSMLRVLYRLVDTSINREGTIMGLLAGTLFVIHPVQTQAVSYIVQRFTSLATMFYLLAIVLYLCYRMETKTIARRFYYTGALVSGICAMLSKEIAFTLPFMLVILEMTFLKKGKKWLYLVPFFVVSILVPLQHISVQDGTSAIFEATRVTAQGFTYPRDVYFFTEMSVILRYWRLLIWPVDLRFYYSWLPSSEFWKTSVILPALLHLNLIFFSVGLIVAVRKGRASIGWTLVSFGILWFYICLSVESTVIPLPDFIFEHRLYLPSIGPFMAFSWVAMRLMKSHPLRYPVAAVLVILIVSLSITTYRRNALWSNDILFWKDNIRKAMDNVAPHFQLGISYQQRGMHREAIEEFNLAAMLRPDYYAIYELMGRSYEAMGWFPDAVSSYKKALKLNPQDASVWALLGRVYLKMGQKHRAIEACRKAMSINPYDRNVLLLNRTLKCQ